MIDLGKYLEPYERKARLYPALICIFPIMLGVAVSFKDVFTALSGLVALAVSVGMLQFLANLARDRGKSIEATLFEQWDGMPSVRFFRHRDSTIPSPAKMKYHAILSKASKIKSPSVEEEKQNPKQADEIYLSWSDFLRGKTRDTKKYNLLFKENIGYGFRRNLFGIRWFCVVSSLIGIGLTNAEIIMGKQTTDITFAVSLLFSVYAVVFLFVVNRAWVKVVADAYAKQLIEAVNA
ncbi:hypothetical protein A6M27_04470 [Acidithiobacillus thiooxidans]|uniref:Uncharacterized protein n=2 Tax=Acidithiobacillus thiooxidans TaxID=930 RepID=A0A1C2IES2_ACITH|nr:hypothetical protein [Acidithiobacillus thiooxidans]MDA8153919.1 hypothetical protein [Acidithiobacillus sp.]OCX74463.1 hypothetical protein A6M23_06175 [Acidithiobacillus thiooxidans]OCX74825.1 hypothetical protein A6P07_04905 [Acidithiobacillus thiooxidans]OCX78608.1 hypothetical protein A6O24_04145 [Acidithiobacillus thiooxidans]OCX85427.1 hypothetical protein A6O26_01145 [Acidithiobacillus thiooxidans]